jgi:GntR family transcriptional repressor for pyruvate dehydrogenase complex
LTLVRFDRVERRTVTEEVRDAIAVRIETGDLPPGSQLPSERDLCEQFAVARTSVREAIHGLVSIGLLERRGNRCYVVERLRNVRFDAVDGRKQRVRELFEVRQVVEVPIARLAAIRATPEQREELVRMAAAFRPTMPLEEFRRLDRAFHSAVARACGNATLAELYGKVMESLFASADFNELLSSRTNRRAVREVIRAAIAAHARIAEAISSGESAEAMVVAEGHLEQVEDQMISRMS